MSNDEVHVWSILVKSLASQESQFSEILSSEERSRANALIHAVDRERFIVAHGVLRSLLGVYLNIEPAEVHISTRPHEKPCLEGQQSTSQIQFNLSHSRDYVVLAFSIQRQIGVDVEYMRPLPDLAQIAAMIFSAQEKRRWERLPLEQRVPAFYHLWTQKEALVKALGKGFSYPLDQFSTSIMVKNQKSQPNIHNNPIETARWTILRLEVAKEYAAALAVEGKSWKLVSCNYPPGETKQHRRTSSYPVKG